jgi:hypothetical protein
VVANRNDLPSSVHFKQQYKWRKFKAVKPVNCRKCDRAGCQAAMWIQYGLAGTECRWVWRIYPPACGGGWGVGGAGGGAHSSPALSHIKVKNVEHVDVTICEIFTRVFGTNVGA